MALFRLILIVEVDDETFTCQFCQRTYNSAPKLLKHQYVHNEKKFECPYPSCSTKFTTLSRQKYHTRTIHEKDKRHSCSFCKKKFSSPAHLKAHSATHTNDYPYKCSLCSKGYVKSDGLKEHVKVQHENILNICEHCGKQFKQFKYFQQHVAKHLGVAQKEAKVFLCNLCDKLFHTYTGYNRHMKKHAGTLGTVCNLCGVKVIDLKRHRLSHTNEKPFGCSLCPKEFKQKSALKCHEAVHSRENHKCLVCGEVFGSRVSFKRHFRSHRVDEMCKCLTCLKLFPEEKALLKHRCFN